MATDETKLKTDIFQIIAWIAILPAFAFWPILSIFPAIALWMGSGSSLEISIQAVLLVTGFWGVAGLFLFVWLLLSTAAKARLPAVRRQRGVFIGFYATLWTVLYVIAAFANR